MNKKQYGFMLLEAILAVLIISISLTFITQALLTNFRTGIRFQEGVRSLAVMENRLGLLFVTGGSEDLIQSGPQDLDKPYDKFTVSVRTDTINDHLKQVQLTLGWPTGSRQNFLDVTTVLYASDQAATHT